jgi:hypothetical protein
MDDENTKQWIGRVIQGIHLVYCILVIVLPYVVTDLFWLCVLVVNNALVLLLWYLCGGCFVNDIENWFLGTDKYGVEGDCGDGEQEKSFMMKWLIQLFGDKIGKYLTVLCSCIPVINTVVCMWKIYGLKMGEVGGVGLSNRVILDGVVSIV